MITDQDLQNLKIVFTLARHQLIANEDELLNLIQFRKQLFEKLISVKNRENTTKVQEHPVKIQSQTKLPENMTE